MPCAIAFKRPDFHFAEALSAELRFSAKRLLGDERVWTDGTHVRLVFNEVVELQHVNLPDHDAVIERLTGATVEKLRLAVFRQTSLLQFFTNLALRSRNQVPA